MDLTRYKSLIENHPIHIATVNKHNKPNVSVASDVKVLDENTLIISCNEMNNTQNNIQIYNNVALTSFDSEWVGIRMFGKAYFYRDGKYYEYCEKTFFANNEVTPFGAVKPKGAIVIKIDKIENLK
ncbi:MAG: pyridoxamine 5'-phosphate oxidase family protein [Bacilli bacterium]|nr:pyridoxamine 5'-phosphate oxidase family protein [Bacilli bacterium]